MQHPAKNILGKGARKREHDRDFKHRDGRNDIPGRTRRDMEHQKKKHQEETGEKPPQKTLVEREQHSQPWQKRGS